MIIEGTIIRQYHPEGDVDFSWDCPLCGQKNEETDFNCKGIPHSQVVTCKFCRVPGQSIEFKRS